MVDRKVSAEQMWKKENRDRPRSTKMKREKCPEFGIKTSPVT